MYFVLKKHKYFNRVDYIINLNTEPELQRNDVNYRPKTKQ